jgi:hypothetical protein
LALGRSSRAYIALSVMGIAVAVYHAYGEITYTILNLHGACNINSFLSCGSVFASGYTTFPPAGSIPGLGKGIEFWVYGVVWFPVALLVGLWVINRYGGPRASTLVPFLMIGNIFTLYPWDIEIRILHGIFCLPCVSLYCINYLMTIVAATSRSTES